MKRRNESAKKCPEKLWKVVGVDGKQKLVLKVGEQLEKEIVAKWPTQENRNK